MHGSHVSFPSFPFFIHPASPLLSGSPLCSLPLLLDDGSGGASPRRRGCGRGRAIYHLRVFQNFTELPELVEINSVTDVVMVMPLYGGSSRVQEFLELMSHMFLGPMDKIQIIERTSKLSDSINSKGKS
ncbi:hypothetical protein PVAP13_8NG104802 [Panicum virgatum]|uniref:Uncharacterized protein n=1 Tax=Panicum virgatum TaxID=38727 RepID=A0A8T0PBF1_PANVG|nr:hypothetical protein PVAP13_8NG104802 [Panicum virgatum]